jgi:hypothetical protein
MKKATQLQGLTCWVQQVLETGIRLDKTLTDHLEVTFGSADVAAILADPTSCESASFLELLFFPDDRLRLDFEHHWGVCIYSDQDVDALVRSLTDMAVTATIYPPETAAPVELEVPDFALAAFVQRLNITWQPATPLRHVLESVVTADNMPMVRSRLRHLRLPWHPSQIELIERFLTRFAVDACDFDTCFAFLSALLTEMGSEEEPFDFLIAKKHFFFQALCKAERFERLRQTSNMETLMLQGARIAHGSTAQWRDQMQLVDRICESLYGQTRFFRQPSEQEADPPGQADGQSMAELLRLLS